jgi:hypothetical protein
MGERASELMFGLLRPLTATWRPPSRQASGRDPTVILLTEIIGLQMFLTNALALLLQGARMSAEQYQDLMRHVKANKHKAAQEVLIQKKE